MARPPRIEIAGAVYHVVARGNERRPVFADDIDRSRFLEVLRGAAERYRWKTLAYCLMGNHYHLLVRTEACTLARGMRHVNGVYAQWFNRRHDRVGHLWQGRYKAVLVQQDEHLLVAIRYVVRNPVRAGLTRRVEDWRWTSHHETVGAARPHVVAVDAVLSYFGADADGGRLHYVRVVGDEADPPPSPHPLVVGDDAFVARHLAGVRPSPEHPQTLVRPSRAPLRELVAGPWDDAGLARANVVHGYSLRELAAYLGCGVTTVHRRVRGSERMLAGTS